MVEEEVDPAAGRFTGDAIGDAAFQQLYASGDLADVLPPARGEVVEHADPGAFGQQALHQVRSNEPGAAGDEHGGALDHEGA